MTIADLLCCRRIAMWWPGVVCMFSAAFPSSWELLNISEWRWCACGGEGYLHLPSTGWPLLPIVLLTAHTAWILCGFCIAVWRILQLSVFFHPDLSEQRTLFGCDEPLKAAWWYSATINSSKNVWNGIFSVWCGTSVCVSVGCRQSGAECVNILYLCVCVWGVGVCKYV